MKTRTPTNETDNQGRCKRKGEDTDGRKEDRNDQEKGERSVDLVAAVAVTVAAATVVVVITWNCVFLSQRFTGEDDAWLASPSPRLSLRNIVVGMT